MVIRIGTCGWSYDHWQPELYAPGPLARYAAAFPTAELNSGFHRWPGHRRSATGGRNLPDGFRPSVKAPTGADPQAELDAP